MSGPTSGGTLVTITGTNLSCIHTIHFGESPTNSIRNVSDTTIIAITPPSDPGMAYIVYEAVPWGGYYGGFEFTEFPTNIPTTETVKATYLDPASDISQNLFSINVSAAGTKLVFNESDNGETFTIPINTEFMINLTESFATNESWLITHSSGLHMIGSQYFAKPGSPRFDVDGIHVFYLNANGSGLQSFHGETKRWGDSPKGRYTLFFKVIP